MSTLALAAAGGTLALPRTLTSSLLPRVMGFYIAGSAGTIQLLDILVDRLALDDRIFAFAILLAVIGIPFAAAGALLAETARGERRRPATARPTTPASGTVLTTAPPAAPVVMQTDDGQDGALKRRLELALSYRRIAELHESAGDAAAAAAQREAGTREMLALADELCRLAADGRSDAAPHETLPPAPPRG